MTKYLSRGPDETRDIGLMLGRLLRRGDVVGLFGELGSGKTTMAKGIGKALGIDDKDIVSASFTIIAEYDIIPRFLHIDLYRIEKKSDLDELGLRDQLGNDCISVVEWAEKADGELPEDMIKVSLKSMDGNIREITIEGLDEKNRDNM